MVSARIALVIQILSLALGGGAGAVASNGTLPPRTASADVAGERTVLFTQRFCEVETCADTNPGVGRSGRANLPVLVASDGDTVAFAVAFAPRSIEVRIQAGAFTTTTVLPGSVWQVPEALPRPATLSLTAVGDRQRARFLAIIDSSIPGPSLDQGRLLGRTTTRSSARATFTVRFRLCSQQTGAVGLDLVEVRLERARHTRRALPRTHLPGCATYRAAVRSPWPGSVLPRPVLEIRARVGRSSLSSPLLLP